MGDAGALGGTRVAREVKDGTRTAITYAHGSPSALGRYPVVRGATVGRRGGLLVLAPQRLRRERQQFEHDGATRAPTCDTRDRSRDVRKRDRLGSRRGGNA